MPNYVINEIELYGNKNEIKRLLDFVKSKDNDFDFDKIIPMPKDLDIVSGGYECYFIMCYIASLSNDDADKVKEKLKATKCKYYGDYYTKVYSSEEKLEHMENSIVKSYPNGFAECDGFSSVADKTIIGIGKKYVDNILTYGTDTWYDWCVTNWGTKWNAFDVCVGEKDVSFTTAWNGVPQLIHYIASLFPNVTIKYRYADENIGYNVGDYCFKGNEIEDNTPNEFEDCEKLACDIWGYEYDE